MKSTFEVYPVRSDGSPFRAILPEEGTTRFDPFPVWHEQGLVTYGPHEAVGFPDHPHRGFETINYIIDGEQYHRDSTGHEGVIEKGDVQWMTAGAGVIHAELPTPELYQRGGSMHAFQIWLNLPRAKKMSPPRYQELRSNILPILQRDGVWARVIAGEVDGVRGPAQTVIPAVFVHVILSSGQHLDMPVPKDSTPSLRHARHVLDQRRYGTREKPCRFSRCSHEHSALVG